MFPDSREYLSSDSKNWKCNLKSEDIIDKYLRPLPDSSQNLKSECKKLAKILNKSQERKPLQNEKIYNVPSVSALSESVTCDDTVGLSFNLMEDDMLESQESDAGYNIKQVLQNKID